jgi:hypothetical protein
MKIHLLLSTKEALAVKVTYQLKLLKIWQLRLVMEVAAAAVAALVMEVAVAVQQVAVAANNALQAESLFFYLID